MLCAACDGYGAGEHTYGTCYIVPASCCVLLSTHSLDLESGGGGDLPACGTPASFSVHLTSSPLLQRDLSTNPSVTSVVRMCVQLKR